MIFCKNDNDDDRHFENGEVWWIWLNLSSMLLDASMLSSMYKGEIRVN